MISFDEAQALLAGAVAPLPDDEVPIAEAAGRVLAEPVHAAIPSPRRDVSAMDGYALRYAEAAVGKSFAVIGESAAGGALPPPVGPGEAVRIFTGAALPPGADGIVIQENCARDGDTMAIVQPFGPGRHVRKAASDFAAGDLLLPAGRVLDPLAMVTLAAADRARVRVGRRPRMALIATGDELAPPGTARDRPLTIPESVSYGVAALAAEHGAVLSARFSGGDDLAALEQVAGEALANADLVVITGGASVGERDFAKPMFAAHGLDLLFAKVAIKPGKPVWLGRAGAVWVLGLPGNPTSAMVTARLFLAPLLAALQGRPTGDLLGWMALPLAAPLGPTGDRETFARAAWAADGLMPIGNQDSGVQGALSQATWLMRCPAGSAPRKTGDMVQALHFQARWP
ncbi:MAG: molybdopterin molybdotransferase MoeA [Sphingomonadales bacterium]|nr:molybdopterin molybdotransferase MoeA [Sphingomonadales bacterium]